MPHRAIAIDSRDTIAVALADLPKGQVCTVRVGAARRAIRLRERIPFGHKFALCRIPKGSKVLKQGEVIGESTEDIEPGAWVHLHNLASDLPHREIKQGRQPSL
jgi:altronate dehydratase small subunit